MEFMFLSRFWGNGEGRKEEEFQSLEVRRKPIALKKGIKITIETRMICLFPSSFGTF